MAAIHFTPVMQPLDPNEVVDRIQHGWVLGGQVLLAQGSGIATPGNPNGGQGVPVNVWVLPEPTVPLGQVVGTILQAEASLGEAGRDVLNVFCQLMLGIDLEKLHESVEQEEGQSESEPVAPISNPVPNWVQ